MENKAMIEDVLKKEGRDIPFESVPDEKDSPLAQPVVDKNPDSQRVVFEKTESWNNSEETIPSEKRSSAGQKKSEDKRPLDAPEQVVDADPEEKPADPPSESSSQESEFTVPLGHATLMADTFLGMVNNILEVGGGFFVTIRKHKDFYDFDELIQVLDEQNERNVKRMRLDEEDKTLLRPLLIQVIRKQAKVLSPEQQLLGAALSIIIKKGRIVMQVRSENEILVDRIRDIIRKERAMYQADQATQEEAQAQTKEPHSSTSNTEEQEETVYTEVST